MGTYRKSDLTAEAPGVAETITRWRGQTMGGRVPAFMGLAQRTGGVFLERPGMTIEEGLREVGLDYEVKLEQVFTHVAQEGLTVVDGEPQVTTEYTPYPIPDYRATVLHYRDGRIVPVAPWVSPKYEIVQNQEALSVGQAIIEEGFGGLVALGAYGRPVGAKTYAALALEGMLVGGEAPVDLALTITNAHDGMGGLSYRLAPLVVACTNETPLYFGKGAAVPYVTRRHTASVKNFAANEARYALGLTAEYRDLFVAETEKAFKVKMDENKSIAYFRKVFGAKPDVSDWTARQATINQAREDTLVELLHGPTTETGKGTAWAAFNAVTEYVDHLAPARGEDATATRQRRIVEGGTDALKQKAWNLALSN